MRGVTRRAVLSSLGSVAAAGGVLGGVSRRASAQSATEWPQYRVDAGSTAWHEEAVVPTTEATEAWTVDVDGVAPPVTDGERVYANEDARLVARRADTGEEVWAADVGDASTTPALDGEYVYAGGETAVHAFRRDDGSRVWRTPVEEPVRGPVRVADTATGDRRLYVQTGTPAVHALATEDGARVWSRTEYYTFPVSATVTRESVVLMTADGAAALSTADGAERWTSEPDPSGPPVRYGSQVVFRTSTGVAAVHLDDGRIEWDRTFDTAPVGIPATIGADLVLVPVGSSLRLLSRPEGDEVDRFSVPTEVMGAPVVTTGGEGGAYWTVADGSGTLYAGALSSDADNPLWRYDIGSQVLGAPAVVGERVYFAAEDGLHALAPAEARQGETTSTRSPTATPTGSPTATVGFSAGGGTDDTGDAQQVLGIPSDLVVPVGGATLVAGGVAGGLLRWLRSDSIDDGSGTGSATGRDGPAGTAPTPRGDGASGDDGADAARPGTGTTGTGASVASDASPAATDGATGGQPLGEGIERGDPSNRPDAVPTTPDLDLSYDDLDRGDRIGAGGNADVYRATASGPDGPVDLAVKEPRLDGTLHAETVERLMTEAETWTKLDDHEAIVGVVDYGSEPLPWIAMEYMDAGHLGDVAPGMSFVQRLWTAYGVVRGVRHAHRRGVAHLDLKPANVLFRSTGSGTWPVPKVGDWGLSKHLLRHSNSVEGLTPAYAAPEQFDDALGPTDNVTDVYQLGAVLYELFTGRPPFEGPNAEIMHAALNEAPDPPSTVVPGLPEAVDEMVLRTLATDRGDRYDSVLYLRDDIRNLVESL